LDACRGGLESWLGSFPHIDHHAAGFCIHDAYGRLYEHGIRTSLIFN
jgi:hypothetical protein